MDTSLAITGQPPADTKRDSRPPTDREQNLWFYFLCIPFALVFLFTRISADRRKQAQKNHASRRKTPPMPAAEITARVTRLAKEQLNIAPHQFEDSMEKLQIPRGDFLSFLDDLEQDHGLQMPPSARSMSTSISGLIADLQDFHHRPPSSDEKG